MVRVDHSTPAELLARCRFPPAGTLLTCAVSGGADSLALLVLATEAGCEVTAVHVDHGLREASAAEADVVSAAAKRLGAKFRAEQVRLEPGPNLEARARASRFAVLPPDVATGHTADDQAETLLINLLRGAGLDGLAAMRPGPRHPILDLRRFEARSVCERAGLVGLEDPSNLDPSYLRNRVRHELIPFLNQLSGRDVVEVLARQAAVIADEADLLQSLATDIDPTDAAALASARPVLARRAVRAWLRDIGRPNSAAGYPPDLATVERVLQVARLETRACEIGAGKRVRRSVGRLYLELPN